MRVKQIVVFSWLSLFLILVLCISFSHATNSTDSSTNYSTNQTLNQTFGSQNNASGNLTDLDGDGYPLGVDCNDNNATIHPGATEIPYNGIDENCDSYDLSDVDHDGYCRQGYQIQNRTLQCPLEAGTSGTDCNDNNPNINPGKKEIPYNRVDDDCNPSTPDRLFFSVKTDKPAYYLGETGTFVINATQNSDVYITFTTPSRTHNTMLSFSGPYPIVQFIPYLGKVGNYFLDAVVEYQNHTNTTRVGFAVQNTITGSINSASTVQKGGALLLSASASGGIGTLSYYWNFGDGTSSNGASVTHIYANAGSYAVRLEINDSEKNQLLVSKTIAVTEKYALTVVVKNSTNAIRGANVEFNGIEKGSDSDGKAVFNSIDAGHYSLQVTKTRYETYTADFDITSNLTKNVELTPQDSSVPVVTLVSPQNGQQFDSGPVSLRFRATDDSNMNCVLYVSYDNSWWSKETVFENLFSDTEKTYELSNLAAGTIYWKVRCEDTVGNAQFSDVFNFVIKEKTSESGSGTAAQQTAEPALTAQSTGDEEDTDSLVAQIDSILNSYDNMPEKEQEVIRLLGLDTNLSSVRKSAQNYNRDLFNVRYRRVNDSERARLVEQIKANFKAQKDSIVSKVTTTDSNSFVKYPSKEELKNFISLMKSTNLSKNIASESSLSKLQSAATVSTKVFVVKLEYLNGNSKTMTLVEKKVDFANTSNIKSIIEYIPKNIANTVDELSIRGDFKVLQKDPILEFGVDKSVAIFYTLDKEVSPSEIEKTLTMVVSANPEETAASITGFAVSDIFGAARDTSSYLVVLIVIIVLISGAAYFWGPLKLMLHLEKREDEATKKLRLLAEKVELNLKENDVDGARILYLDIEEIYRQSKSEVKENVKGQLVDLYNKIRFAELLRLVQRVRNYIEDKDHEKASACYEKLSELYRLLPKEYKEQATPKCLEVYNKLHEK